MAFGSSPHIRHQIKKDSAKSQEGQGEVEASHCHCRPNFPMAIKINSSLTQERKRESASSQTTCGTMEQQMTGTKFGRARNTREEGQRFKDHSTSATPTRNSHSRFQCHPDLFKKLMPARKFLQPGSFPKHYGFQNTANQIVSS